MTISANVTRDSLGDIALFDGDISVRSLTVGVSGHGSNSKYTNMTLTPTPSVNPFTLNKLRSKHINAATELTKVGAHHGTVLTIDKATELDSRGKLVTLGTYYSVELNDCKYSVLLKNSKLELFVNDQRVRNFNTRVVNKKRV